MNARTSNRRADSHIAIEHNTIVGFYIDGIWGQYFGITVHGSPDANNVGYVGMADNIITGSFYYAVVMGDGWIACDGRYNHGYYDNWEIDTGDPWGDIDPVIVHQDPFYWGVWYWPLLLGPDSPFTDAGVANVEQFPYLIGLSTYMGFPDVNMADIGIHYNREGFVNAGVNPLFADFNNDLGVDANDLLIFTSHWLEDGNSPTYDPNTNFDDEDLIDFRDFACLASEWKTRTSPFPPDIAPAFDQGPNNLKGDVTVSIPVLDYVYRAVFLLDGNPATSFANVWDNPTTLLEMRKYANGPHKVKLVVLTENDIFITSPIDVIFSNELSLINAPEGFTSGKDYSYYAMSDPNTYEFCLYDMNDIPVFSQTCQDGINVRIPSNVFLDEEMAFYRLSIAITDEMPMLRMSMAATAGQSLGDLIDQMLTRKFNAGDYPADCNVMMVISIGSKDLQKQINDNLYFTEGDPSRPNRADTIKQVMTAALSLAGHNDAHKRMRVIVLPYEQCTWGNLSYALNLNNVKLWYHYSHGRDTVGIIWKKNRLAVEIKDQWLLSYRKKDFLGNPPPDYEDIGKYEKMPSVRSLGNRSTHKLNWVRFDSCYSGKPVGQSGDELLQNEFAESLGFVTHEGASTRVGIFLGWKGEAYESGFGNYNQFEIDFWRKLMFGGSIEEAYDYGLEGKTTTLRDSVSENWAFYGLNWSYTYFKYPVVYRGF